MMLLLAVACVLIPVGNSLPSGATCNFSWDWNSKPDHSLAGHIIGVKSPVSLLQCIRKCLDLDSKVCRSVNYNKAKRKCQLNSRDDRLETGSVIVSPGWTYYHKRISSPERIEGYQGDHCYVQKCPVTTIPHNDKCIEINVTPRVSFSGGQESCRDKYGSLLTITDQTTFDLLRTALPAGERYYVGFSRDPSNTLIWGDGTPVDTGRFFNGGQPDDFNNIDGPEDCGGMEESGGNYGLNDVPCSLTWSFICEYDKYVYSLW